jgi:hypothetical protein
MWGPSLPLVFIYIPVIFTQLSVGVPSSHRFADFLAKVARCSYGDPSRARVITSCTVVLFTRAFTLIAMNTTLIPCLMCMEPDRNRLAIAFRIRPNGLVASMVA